MVKIDKIVPGGQALGTDESGKKIFFWNALPGEVVEDFQITKNKSHYAEAIALEVANPSKHRVPPQDDCYLSTSPWQIIDYDYELKLKQELVVEIFREHHININIPQIFTDYQDYHYRNKMEYSLYWDNTENKIRLAFHARGSNRKIPIAKSSIERPEIFKTATKIIDTLNANHAEARTYQSLLLRCNQKGEISGGLYENHKPHPTFKPLTDNILGHSYSYSPNGFFQINLPVYEMALKAIKEHIRTDDVLDLYAGVGTIGLSVASNKALTLVEVDKFAFQEMARNITIEDHRAPTGAKTSEAPPVTTAVGAEQTESLLFVSRRRPADDLRSTGRSERVRNGNILAILDKSESVINYIQPNQTVILDPPRAGCDQKLIHQLLKTTPEKIIYLSCNPATQARDIKLLLAKYHLDDVKTFNFFPHTPHIENLIILSRR